MCEVQNPKDLFVPITFDGKRKAKIEVTAMHVNIKWVGGYMLRI